MFFEAVYCLQCAFQDVELNELRATINALRRHNYANMMLHSISSGSGSSRSRSPVGSSSSGKSESRERRHHRSSDSVKSESGVTAAAAAHGAAAGAAAAAGSADHHPVKKHKSWVRSASRICYFIYLFVC